MEDNLNQPSRDNIAKKNPQIKKAVLLTLVLTLLTSLYFYFSSQQKSNALDGTKTFKFQSIKKKTFDVKAYEKHIDIAQLKGKILFLKVFGWNCKYCQKEIPELIKLKNKFKTSFDTIAIESQEYSMDESLNFIEKYHINYNVLEGEKHQDFLKYLKDTYKWNGVIPLTIVIDGKGKVLAFEAGYKSYSLTTLLQTTLKELTTVATEPQHKSRGH